MVENAVNPRQEAIDVARRSMSGEDSGHGFLGEQWRWGGFGVMGQHGSLQQKLLVRFEDLEAAQIVP